MKAVKVFADRNNEVALTPTGQWYGRSFGFNGFGVGWSKWEPIAPPSPVIEIENRYSGEMTSIEPDTCVMWGFDRLSRTVGVRRLPNN
jgi:hypothetical protein